MSDAKLRLTGRPKIERDTNGLRKITRTYVVQGSAVTEGNIENEVFLPFGTPDEEYDATITQDLTNGGLSDSEVTGAYLVQQAVSPGQSMNEAVLTRVYQELEASGVPVLVGKDQINRGAQDRLTLGRSYIVKNPYSAHYAEGRVGVVAVDVDNGVGGLTNCLLGSITSKPTEVYTEFNEIYYEDGILSESVDYRYGQYPDHKLELRTLRSVATPTPPSTTEGPGSGPWFQIAEKSGPGSQDFGQIGKTIQTVVFAKGYGLISKDAKVKGKPPNTVEVTTIRYLTGENGVIPDSEIPNFTRRTVESKEEKEGYELHTIAGIVVSTDNGVVDVSVDYKHGEKPAHKLEVARAVSYGIPATSQNVLDFVYPGGDTTTLGDYVLVEEREDTKDEFDVYTTTFARGFGTISDASKKVGLTTVTETVSLHPSNPVLSRDISGNELTRDVDQLDGYQKLRVTITTDQTGLVDLKTDYRHNRKLKITTATQLGSVWNSPTYGAEISTRNHTYNIYPAITKSFALGEGIISSQYRKSGQAIVVEYTSLHNNRPTPPDDVLSHSIREVDGHFIMTYSVIDEDTDIIDIREEHKHFGALITKTITAFGESWDASNTPNGYYELSSRSHDYQSMPAITKVFVRGDGLIDVQDRDELYYKRTTSKYMSLYADPPVDVIAGIDAVNVGIQKSHGYTIITWDKLSNHPISNESLAYQGGLQVQTLSNLNAPPSGSGDRRGRSIKSIDSRNLMYENEFVTPLKWENTAISWGAGIKTTTVGSIASSDNYGDEGSVEQLSESYYRLRSTTVDKAEFSSYNKNYSNGLLSQVTESIYDSSTPVSSTNADPDDGGSISLEGSSITRFNKTQISENLFRNLVERVSSTDFVDTQTSYGKFQNMVTSTTFTGAVQPKGDSISARSYQVSPSLFKNVFQNAEDSNFDKEEGFSALLAGGIKKTTTLSKTAPSSDYWGNYRFVDDKVGNVYTQEVFEITPGGWVDKSVQNRGYIKTTINSTLTTDSSDPQNLTTDEFDFDVTQVAPGIYRKRITTREFDPGSKVLSKKVQIVEGGRLEVVRTLADPYVHPSSSFTLISADTSVEIVAGKRSDVYTTTYFEPESEDYYSQESRSFNFAGNAQLTSQGIIFTPGYRGLISIRVTHKLDTVTHVSSLAPYAPPQCVLEYTAVPADGRASFTETRAFSNCFLGTQNFNSGPQWFKGVWCSSVTPNLSGEVFSANYWTGYNWGNSNSVKRTYGPIRIFHSQITESI